MNKLSVFLQKAQGIILRYPMVLLMSFIMTTAVIYTTESQHDYGTNNLYQFTKIIIVSSLGISFMFALKMLVQRVGKEVLIQISGLIFLLCFYYFVLPSNKEDFTGIYVFVIIPTFILSHLLVAVIAFFGKEYSEKNFWEYNKSLFVNLFLTSVFTQVLTGGVELAIMAIHQLFNIDFSSDVYLETFFSLTIFGSTFIFLLFNDEGLSSMEKERTYPVFLKFFTQFILIPLLFIYVVILYLYSFKIILAWELPHGWVSYLVLAYSSVGILALLLVHPLKEESAKSWVKVFSKVFYVALIPLLILLFVAIFTRVLQYGYTEARYFVLLIALWLATVVLYFVFNKKSNIKFIPISLFMFLLFALIFPYFNAFSVSIRSQKNQLEKLLDEHALLENGKIKFTKYIGNASMEISEKFTYLNERNQKEYLKQYLPKTIQDDLDKNRSFYLNSYFYGARLDTINGGEDYTNISKDVFVTIENQEDYFNTAGYTYAYTDNRNSGGRINSDQFKVNDDEFKIDFSPSGDDKFFKLTLNDNETVDLLPLLQKFFENHNDMNETVKMKNLAVQTDLGKYHIKVAFKRISKSHQHSSNYDIIDYYIYDPMFLFSEKK